MPDVEHSPRRRTSRAGLEPTEPSPRIRSRLGFEDPNAATELGRARQHLRAGKRAWKSCLFVCLICLSVHLVRIAIWALSTPALHLQLEPAGDPAGIAKAVEELGYSKDSVLHVRSFLDHDRPFIAPKISVESTSKKSMWVSDYNRDGTYLNKLGEPLSPVVVYQSLVEHFQRWSEICNKTLGLLFLEVCTLDPATTEESMTANVSLHFDILEFLSRQYMVPAPVLTLALAEAGLFPSCRSPLRFPSMECAYTRILLQQVVKLPYNIRLAEPSDIDALVSLEKTWGTAKLNVSKELIQSRLDNSNEQFVCVETSSGKVVGVLYTQRIAEVQALQGTSFSEQQKLHTGSGQYLQFLGLNSDAPVSVSIFTQNVRV